MADSNETPVVVFGKLSGTGLLLLGVAAIIAAGAYLTHSVAAPSEQQTAPAVTQQPAVFSEHDFQLVQLGEMRRDQFLYDKRTGRIWSSICTGQVSGPNCNGMLVWQEMYVDGVTPPGSQASVLYQFQIQSQKSK